MLSKEKRNGINIFEFVDIHIFPNSHAHINVVYVKFF